MPTLLVCLRPDLLPDDRLGEIRAAAPGYTVVRTVEKDDVRAHLAETEIAFGRFPAGLVAEAPRLRWIQSWDAGLNWLFDHDEFDADAARDLAVTSGSGIHGVPIGEHVFAFLLAFSRRLKPAVLAQNEGRWAPDEVGGDGVFELDGGRMLLLGAGAIGTRVIRLAEAFGMETVVIRNSEQETPGALRTVGVGALLDELPDADAVVNTLPMTRDTQGLFGADAFAAMKPSAVFVNIGRGGTVDEAAMIAALRDGRIAGAGLDVFEEEPLPPDSPLWTLPNVVLTPHVAGSTPRYADRALALFADNLARWRDERPLINRVDPERGY